MCSSPASAAEKLADLVLARRRTSSAAMAPAGNRSRGARGGRVHDRDVTRLPDSLIARLDRHVERMTKEHPGLDFTRADAVRSLLTRALDQIEGASAPTKRGGR